MYYVKNRYQTGKKCTVNGVLYDSKFEGNYAGELELRKRMGDIKSWERQVKIPLVYNGYHIANYYIDFIVHHNDGRTEYIECKGYPHEVWKMKWKIFESLYADLPDVLLTVIQQKSGAWKIPHARKLKPKYVRPT
jgi:hypothetical protein